MSWTSRVAGQRFSSKILSPCSRWRTDGETGCTIWRSSSKKCTEVSASGRRFAYVHSLTCTCTLRLQMWTNILVLNFAFFIINNIAKSNNYEYILNFAFFIPVTKMIVLAKNCSIIRSKLYSYSCPQLSSSFLDPFPPPIRLSMCDIVVTHNWPTYMYM